jgi:hypothetical protein
MAIVRSNVEQESEPPRCGHRAEPRIQSPAAVDHRGVLTLQRAIGNRATRRLLRDETGGAPTSVIGPTGAVNLQRDFVDDLWPTDPETVNSPFPLRVLMHWLRQYPVAPHDLNYESAYDRNQVEPDPLGCTWKGGSSNISSVTDRFMAESAPHGYSFRRDDVFAVIREQVAQVKHERAPDISFMPKSAWNAMGDAWEGWFPWPAYELYADQFSLAGADLVTGAGGPIVDWLEWYEFDAPWPPVADPDACLFHAQGENAGRVLGVVRLYCNDAIRAGYLGVDRGAVESHVRNDLEERKRRKSGADHSRFSRIDGRGRTDSATPGGAAGAGSGNETTREQPEESEHLGVQAGFGDVRHYFTTPAGPHDALHEWLLQVVTAYTDQLHGRNKSGQERQFFAQVQYSITTQQWTVSFGGQESYVIALPANLQLSFWSQLMAGVNINAKAQQESLSAGAQFAWQPNDWLTFGAQAGVGPTVQSPGPSSIDRGALIFFQIQN